jgi:succinate dehydrogenase / fumarate reductase cytochrome b subunit
MADVRPANPRPLSPHLQVFRPLITMVMSILHRITGSALYLGTLLFAWWLLALASGPEAFAPASAFLRSWFGQIILFGFTWALVHHGLGGIRHFIWDLGYGYGLPARNLLAKATIVGSVAVTVILWILAFLIA